MSLLDIPDDSVREGVAAALGNVGRRADVAIPKLKELLPELVCRKESSDLAQVAPAALGRMGEKEPPAKCGKLR